MPSKPSKKSKTPMTSQSAARIQSTTARSNDGIVEKATFAARAQAAAQTNINQEEIGQGNEQRRQWSDHIKTHGLYPKEMPMNERMGAWARGERAAQDECHCSTCNALPVSQDGPRE